MADIHEQVLNKTSRIELGNGVTGKLIDAFCSSPYISQQNYEETLHELRALFYEYKNETLEGVSDDELIDYMQYTFNGECSGSLELLEGAAYARGRIFAADQP